MQKKKRQTDKEKENEIIRKPLAPSRYPELR